MIKRFLGWNTPLEPIWLMRLRYQINNLFDWMEKSHFNEFLIGIVLGEIAILSLYFYFNR